MTANKMAADFALLKDGAGFKDRDFNDREISYFLSAAERELVINEIDGLKNRTQRGLDTEIRQNEVGSLLSSHITFKVENNDFMMGTEDNGAFRTPDLDAQLGTVERYGIFVNIPDEVLIPLGGMCTVVKNNKTTDLVRVQDVSATQYSNYILDPYKNPDSDLVWRMNTGSFTPSHHSNEPSVKGLTGVSAFDKTTEVYLDTNRSHHLIPGNGYTVKSYNLHYIKLPAGIVVNVRNPELSKDSELPTFMHDAIVKRALRIAASSNVPAEGAYDLRDKETRETE